MDYGGALQLLRRSVSLLRSVKVSGTAAALRAEQSQAAILMREAGGRGMEFGGGTRLGGAHPRVRQIEPQSLGLTADQVADADGGKQSRDAHD